MFCVGCLWHWCEQHVKVNTYNGLYMTHPPNKHAQLVNMKAHMDTQDIHNCDVGVLLVRDVHTARDVQHILRSQLVCSLRMY